MDDRDAKGFTPPFVSTGEQFHPDDLALRVLVARKFPAFEPADWTDEHLSCPRPSTREKCSLEDYALLLARRHTTVTKCAMAELRKRFRCFEHGASLKRFMKSKSIDVTRQSGQRSPLTLGMRLDRRPG